MQAIWFLQEKELINRQLKPEFIIAWLVASIDVMLDDDLALFKNNAKNQKKYINMLIDTLTNGLA